MAENYRVSLDIYPLDQVDGISSVLRIGQGGNFEKYGDQNPAIFFNNTFGQSSISIKSSINGFSNFEVILPGIPVKEWTSVVIDQSQKKFL